MTILNSLNQFSKGRLSWLLLLLFVVFFEACALYFQHVMMLAPCVMCIYERVAMMGVGVAAIVGLMAPNNPVFRWLGLIGWGLSSYKGLLLAQQHVDYQFNPSPFATCDLFVTFPSWAPLNQWVPWMFEAYGDCSKIVWQFLDLSMPQWLVVIFAGNLIALALIVIAQFFPARRTNPIR
ncbi:disulfide bond formation protein DsbB [Vibrio diabolicus]|uniref:Disulfide bond formation protein B n=2 Tax=Vibrio diabolicus subgroup TaxID=2315253 RepID=A0A2L2K954_9VIBR|nr:MULTISPECIES: disulfide bond formation protein DsbB [Vibrio]MCF7451845.1 disulfide bond formation protein DsbB [Vibrio sp. A1-1]MCK8064696.1 disulfide bond formation protein DsbB [Vibrio sp. 1CM7H]MCR9567727.1 disulfide bond formation protein DsbB [Vibrio alginolyticus]MEA3481887.1 disulfide bond formation protein DsbB [Pseudomonadota bacterium]NAW82387.1 disulfide bond formation protein DsbB [Vibrio sp. V43_P6S15P86]NNN55077.1 disulfide bond formation protein DsbB [Vibrio sp. 1-2 (7-a)]R